MDTAFLFLNLITGKIWRI